MAELASLTATGGVVGDTFGELEIRAVFADGDYAWGRRTVEAEGDKPVTTATAGDATIDAETKGGYTVVDMDGSGSDVINLPATAGLTAGDRFSGFNTGANAGTLTPDGADTLSGTASVPAGAEFSVTYIGGGVWASGVVAGGGSSIYDADGTLAGARSVTLGGNDLTFVATNPFDNTVIADSGLNSALAWNTNAFLAATHATSVAVTPDANDGSNQEIRVTNASTGNVDLQAPNNMTQGNFLTLTIENQDAVDRTVDFAAEYLDSTHAAVGSVLIPAGADRSYTFAKSNLNEFTMLGVAAFPAGSINLYDNDGTLSGARTITTGGNALVITDGADASTTFNNGNVAASGLVQGFGGQQLGQITADGFLDFTTAEPASPGTNDTYVATVTGASNVTATAITTNVPYRWNGSAWEAFPILGEGLSLYDASDDSRHYYDGAAWIQISDSSLYTADGTLTGARAVTLSSNVLSFIGDDYITQLDVNGELITDGRALGANGGQSGRIFVESEVDFTTAEPDNTSVSGVYLNTGTGNGSISTGTSFSANTLWLSKGTGAWIGISRVEGQEIYLRDTNGLKYWDGAAWVEAISDSFYTADGTIAGAAARVVSMNGNNVQFEGNIGNQDLIIDGNSGEIRTTGAVVGMALNQHGVIRIDGFVDFTTSEPVLAGGEIYVNTVTGSGSITTGTTFSANRLYRALPDNSDWGNEFERTGMVVFNEADGFYYSYDGTAWGKLVATGAFSQTFIVGDWSAEAAGVQTYSVPAATHLLGTSVNNVEVYETIGGNEVKVSLDEIQVATATGDVTLVIAGGEAFAGKVVIS